MVFQIILDVLLAILVVGVIVIIIADTGDSGRKIAWLLVITLLPVVGAVLYLCFGYNWRNHGVFQRQHRQYLDKWETESDERVTELLLQDPQFLHQLRGQCLYLRPGNGTAVQGDLRKGAGSLPGNHPGHRPGMGLVPASVAESHPAVFSPVVMDTLARGPKRVSNRGLTGRRRKTRKRSEN